MAGCLNGHFALLHYASDGTQDTSFGGASGGIVTDEFRRHQRNALRHDAGQQWQHSRGRHEHADSSGKDFALARFNADGTLDTTFGTGGLVTTDFAGDDATATAMAIQPPTAKSCWPATADDGSGYETSPWPATTRTGPRTPASAAMAA